MAVAGRALIGKGRWATYPLSPRENLGKWMNVLNAEGIA